MFYNLPNEILRHIYLFDNTFREKYDLVIFQLELINSIQYDYINFLLEDDEWIIY